MLGRIGETKIADGLGDIVVVGCLRKIKISARLLFFLAIAFSDDIFSRHEGGFRLGCGYGCSGRRRSRRKAARSFGF
jgi:hypothetical protein